MSTTEDVHVLVVEDEFPVRAIITRLTQEAGYTVIGEAENGIEAVEKTQSLRPDVVLMDVRMPDMNGIEATREIQARCPTPVVILTAFETSHLIEEASQAGVAAYLIKPPTTLDIERSITIALARFRDMMELRRLNTHLETRNKELDAFAHAVAHDLQNPLSLIIGFAEALGKYNNTIPEDELCECLKIIEQNGRALNCTVKQLLLLAKTHDETVQVEPLDMASIITKAQERLAQLIAEHKAEIILPETWPASLGHSPWVEEVWLNYLSNAIKFGGSPPRVKVGAQTQLDGTVSFWIHDNGNERIKDHGVGLSIAQRIVERLGGQTDTGGLSEDGNVYIFTLPAASEH